MTAKPLVSIGVPTYNRVDKLKRSVPHMLSQDYGSIEIVVSDNASTDGTRAFCEDLSRTDSRVKYHRQPTNVGPILNYGKVIELASGEYYMHLADDDDLQPSYVAKCVDALASDPTLIAVCGRAHMLKDGSFVRESSVTNLLHDSPSQRVRDYFADVTDNNAFHSVVRRQTFLALPPMRGKTLGVDWLWMSGLAFMGRIRTLDGAIVAKHMGGATRTPIHMARTLGVSELQGRVHVEVVMWNVFRDIAWESPVYASLGTAGRITLAGDVLAILVRRFRHRWKSRNFYVGAFAGLIPRDAREALKNLRRHMPSR